MLDTELNDEEHSVSLDRLDAVASLYEHGTVSPTVKDNAASALLRWLTETCDLLVSEQHDRLHAIRGICGNLSISLPRPDYALPVDELWKRISSLRLTSIPYWTIDTQGMPDPACLMLLAGLQKLESGTGDVSWVLDMSRLSGKIYSKYRFLAATTSAVIMPMSSLFLPERLNAQELGCHGQVLCDISSVACRSAWPSPERKPENHGHMWVKLDLLPWLNCCQTFAVDHEWDDGQAQDLHLMELLAPRNSPGEWDVDHQQLANLSRSSTSAEGKSVLDEGTDGSLYVSSTSRLFDFHRTNKGVQLAVTLDSQFCWIPSHASVGDRLCVLYGAPFVLCSGRVERIAIVSLAMHTC
ncbi:hypothetical protein DOTSEDRAFT_180608, partial [Dothistroma septosporum NZE10]